MKSNYYKEGDKYYKRVTETIKNSKLARKLHPAAKVTGEMIVVETRVDISPIDYAVGQIEELLAENFGIFEYPPKGTKLTDEHTIRIGKDSDDVIDTLEDDTDDLNKKEG